MKNIFNLFKKTNSVENYLNQVNKTKEVAEMNKQNAMKMLGGFNNVRN